MIKPASLEVIKKKRANFEQIEEFCRCPKSFLKHMDHEGIAQLFVRLTTRNFEEAVAARKDKRAPQFKD